MGRSSFDNLAYNATSGLGTKGDINWCRKAVKKFGKWARKNGIYKVREMREKKTEVVSEYGFFLRKEGLSPGMTDCYLMPVCKGLNISMRDIDTARNRARQLTLRTVHFSFENVQRKSSSKSAMLKYAKRFQKIPNVKFRKGLRKIFRWKAYTDGGYVSQKNCGAYGIVLISPCNIRERYSQAFVGTTNNRMELRGVLKAIELLKEKGIRSFDIYTDSKYVKLVAEGTWLRTKNLDLWSRFDELTDDTNINIYWVKAHANNKDNNRCDSMATEAIQKGEFIEDEGYKEDDIVTEPNSIHLCKDLIFPDTFKKIPDITNVEEYMGKYIVSRICAESIIQFYEPGSTKWYSYLKTGGKDHWSKSGFKEMEQVIGKEAAEFLQKNIPDRAILMTSMRWASRGLAISDAYEKARTDAVKYTKMPQREHWDLWNPVTGL